MTPLFRTQRLDLNLLSDQDAPWMFRLLNEPSFIRFIGDKGIRTLDDAKRYISERAAQSYSRWGYGLYSVKLREIDEFIGICGLVKRESLVDADIGFAFFPAHWSKGFAGEAAIRTLEYAQNELKLKCVLGVTSLNNQASIRVLEKIGLKFDRLIQFQGATVESRLFRVDFPVDFKD